MLSLLSDLYEGLKDEYRHWRDGPQPPPAPAPASTPTPSPLAPTPPAPSPPAAATLPAVKRWSHPFGDKSDPLQQLTRLAKAVAGYYPIGVNGMWHGGVHFDAGTAGILKQDHVRCIADGEVVAYRIPGRTPKTTYFLAPGVTAEAPFASAFVLVRHRLEAPALKDSTDKPPSLTFFSLYMHLQDWASYKADVERKRPTFWPEGFTLRVKATANDISPNALDQRGVKLVHQPRHGKTIDFLPRGTLVTVSGDGEYRKIKGSKGPKTLQNSDGTLRGYIEFARLQAAAGDVYRVAGADASLDVLAGPNAQSEKLFKLPKDSEVTISGEGRFRKLESIAQYVQFASLERLRKPAVQNRVLVLEKPVPIKAGELIGHLGPYQENNETAPQNKLHLEVFTADDMKAFLAASRVWAARMPDTEKTWLKIAGCVPVVTPDDSFSVTKPPTLFDPGTPSTADLLVPKSLLDDLPATHKIQIPATEGRKAINWYRLDDQLNDLDGKLLKGWVREEVGVTPWVNPWSWDGYDIIVNDDQPENGFAYMLDALGLSKEEDRERNRPRVDASDKGPVKTRLYDIIDKDRNGKITAKEMRAALGVPAYAQSIAQLVIHYESEWYYRQSKWDALDQVLGHTTSAPMLNWIAEKERIKQLGWWAEVVDKVVLPKGGKVYHLHPLVLGGWFSQQSCACDRNITLHEFSTILSSEQLANGLFTKSAYPEIRNTDAKGFLELLNDAMDRFEIRECLDKAFFLANLALECDEFRTTEEYKNRDGSIPSHWNNYRGGQEYHGRGLIQLTHKENYESYFKAEGVPVNTPLGQVAKDLKLASGSAVWYWRKGSAWGDLSKFSHDNDFIKVVIGVNGGFNHAYERQKYLFDLIDRLKVRNCSVHGGRLYERYKFSESSLSQSRSGSAIWKNYFGVSDEIFKR